MLHYEHVDNDLIQAEKTIRMALKSECDTASEKAALEEALNLVEKARETCRLVQKESITGLFTQNMNM